MSTGFCVVLTTVDKLDLAKMWAKSLIEAKLAACVTVLPQATSFYVWEGSLEEASEVLLLIKTHQDKSEELMAFLKSQHPYTLPEIIQLPIIGGSQSYLDWLKSSLS